MDLKAPAAINYRISPSDLTYLYKSCKGTGNLRALDRHDCNVYVVDSDQFTALTPEEEALRILEVVAHSFHDRAARECVRGLFE